MSSTPALSPLDPSPYSFCPVDFNNPDHEQNFAKCLLSPKEVINQENKTLLTGKEGREHYKAEFLIHLQKIVGVIAYGKELKEVPISKRPYNWLEIHLLLLAPSEPAGLGYRTKLLHRIKTIAREVQATGLHIWLSTQDLSGTCYFTENRFRRIEVIDDRPPLNQLFLLELPLIDAAASSSIQTKRARTEENNPDMSSSNSDERNPKRHEH